MSLWSKLKKKKLIMNVLLSGVILWVAYNIPGMSSVLGDYLTILVLVMLLMPLIYAGRK